MHGEQNLVPNGVCMAAVKLAEQRLLLFPYLVQKRDLNLNCPLGQRIPKSSNQNYVSWTLLSFPRTVVSSCVEHISGAGLYGLFVLLSPHAPPRQPVPELCFIYWQNAVVKVQPYVLLLQFETLLVPSAMCTESE